MANRCQSCGMPLKQVESINGTNADGTKSTTYCALCFENGEFLQPDFSVEEMQRFCIDQLKLKGMPGFLGWLFTRGLPKLERWKS